MSINETRIARLETIVGTRIGQAGSGPCVGCYMAVCGTFIEDSRCERDQDLIAPDDADASLIEALAWERHQRRIARGEGCGLPVDELPDELRAVLVDFGGAADSAGDDPATNSD